MKCKAKSNIAIYCILSGFVITNIPFRTGSYCTLNIYFASVQVILIRKSYELISHPLINCLLEALKAKCDECVPPTYFLSIPIILPKSIRFCFIIHTK